MLLGTNWRHFEAERRTIVVEQTIGCTSSNKVSLILNKMVKMIKCCITILVISDHYYTLKFGHTSLCDEGNLLVRSSQSILS